ncbi:MAG TPA: bestrophin family ion channel [Flavobacteriales bacterium]|nr:bestrophin family ion channel [Flavobacteriales bacterium]
MQAYDPRNWLGALALHRSDTFLRLLPYLLLMGLFTAVVGWIEVEYLRLEQKSYVSHLTLMHSLLGFAISILLVFRTNTAYDRWWEGRKLWGQLVNTSRNLAVKIDAYVPEDATTRSFYARLIPLFAHELRSHLQLEKTRLALDASPHPEIPDFDRSKHLPNQVMQLMTERTYRLQREGVITGEQLLTLDREQVQFLEIAGACERIKNTPIPYSYSSFIKKFIVVYVVTMPFGFAFSLGYLATPVVMFILYVLASLELIAERIEDPFGDDVNDLPMDRLATMIKGNVEEILA